MPEAVGETRSPYLRGGFGGVGGWVAGSALGSSGMYVLGGGERGLWPAWGRREGEGEGGSGPQLPSWRGASGAVGSGQWAWQMDRSLASLVPP